MVMPVLAGCGASAARQVAGDCVPTPVVRGAPPGWSKAAWSMSSHPVRLPYALASGDVAMAVVAVGSLRAGHPTNPANKVLWVVRFPRQGRPLLITARQGDRVVQIRLPPDSSPGEIYPSYVDLPTPGCWRLALAWGPHQGNLNVEVQPAGAPRQSPS
jgi:hypothetical protein